MSQTLLSTLPSTVTQILANERRKMMDYSANLIDNRLYAYSLHLRQLQRFGHEPGGAPICVSVFLFR